MLKNELVFCNALLLNHLRTDASVNARVPRTNLHVEMTAILHTSADARVRSGEEAAGSGYSW